MDKYIKHLKHLLFQVDKAQKTKGLNTEAFLSALQAYIRSALILLEDKEK
jgi:hypothetical protein